MKQFSDISQEQQKPEGEKVKLEAILDKPIILTNAMINESRFSRNKSGKYVAIEFQYDENSEKHVVFTGSDVLIQQIEKYQDEMPFQATIKRINKYFTLS